MVADAWAAVRPIRRVMVWNLRPARAEALAALVPGVVLVYVCWMVYPLLAIAVGVGYVLLLAVVSAAVRSSTPLAISELLPELPE